MRFLRYLKTIDVSDYHHCCGGSIAFVANYSGMSITMAFVLASTALFSIFFSPIFGLVRGA
ncbi:MAG: L-lactate permease [Saprospiraceae bacterium]|nr:L-lactate permease [Saprospiraceae bacterium]